MQDHYGIVYVMNNAVNNNQIFAFAREEDGRLSRMASYYTGGQGTGEQIVDPLGSQNSIVISKDGCFLFAVNAGSHTISCFAIQETGELMLLDVIDSGGVKPNSIAVFEDILYVTNQGDERTPSNITGFFMDEYGRLRRIPKASYSLSSSQAKPSCIVSSPQGDSLVVSELSENKLDLFPLSCDGTLLRPSFDTSYGAGPFGSVFLDDGILLVSEAGANALSSYFVWDRQQLEVISGSVGNGQRATCWVAIDPSQRHAYTTSAGSNAVSLYDIHPDGRVTFREFIAANPNQNAAPIDCAVSCDGRNLYVLNGNQGSISVFMIMRHGELRLLEVMSDTALPLVGAQGLAVL